MEKELENITLIFPPNFIEEFEKEFVDFEQKIKRQLIESQLIEILRKIRCTEMENKNELIIDYTLNVGNIDYLEYRGYVVKTSYNPKSTVISWNI